MKKKILATLLSSSLLLGMLAACGGAASSAPAVTSDAGAASTSADAGGSTASGGPYKFGYTAMDGTNPFFVVIEKTIREKVEANGDELKSTDPANDVALQINQVEDLISQGIDGMFLNPVDAEGILPALDQLKEAGIPIVNFDTEVADMSFNAATISSRYL